MILSVKCNHWSEPREGEAYFQYIVADFKNSIMKQISRNLGFQLAVAFVLLTFNVFTALAGEGMWLPLLLKSLNEAEMKSMGMKMSAEDIYSVNKGSLKDAVVHFGGFCTGELISDEGLLLTNHHCGYSAIQFHSTLENNYLQKGYWAKNKSDELPTPDLYATFIVRIEDVSTQVFAGIKEEMTVAEKQSVIDRNLNTVKQSAQKESWQDVFIRSFFEGNQYFLFVTETYNDVRYVGSPPESIGKFGADTDNWVWPRHTGDFSLFRIYAGPDNKPAAYSPDNKPLKPKHFFPVSLDGIDEGDFTLVFGFPGRTNQYVPSFTIEQTIDIIDPVRIGVRDISLGIMDKHMRKDEDSRLAYAAKYAGLANSWKKWIGEVQGLKSKNAVKVKEKQEAEFKAALKKNKSLDEEYGNILPELKTVYQSLDSIIGDRILMGEVLGGSNVELFFFAGHADRLVKAYAEKGEAGYNELSKQYTTTLPGVYKNYRKNVDEELFAALTEHLSKNLSQTYKPDFLQSRKVSEDYIKWANEIYQNSILPNQEQFLAAIEKGGESFSKTITEDKGYMVYATLKQVLDTRISPKFNDLNKKVQPLQSDYVKALMETYPDKRFWPDANSTLRVSYGQVEPYAPRDGMNYKTQTYLDGIMEKYKPGDYEFDVDPKLIELYQNKDYGQYGEDGKLPVCFIASNHTTGGNSGSPAIDAYGNLIGINFDRVWEGTMSDLYYDKSICRNIMVDIRYVLFVIDKFAGAGHLVKEMKIVHPKK